TQKRQFDYSESWKTVNLNEVTYIPKKEKLSKFTNEKLLTVKLHCKGVEINTTTIPKITKKGRAYYKRNFKEILIGRQNLHNGGIGIVSQELDEGICSNAITSLKVNKNRVTPYFLYYFLSRTEYYKKTEIFMNGTGQKELSEKELMKLKIKIPSLSEQEQIVNCMTNIDKKIELIKKEKCELSNFKKFLLQTMFC
ncbi:restriction endonuclease subunit S, partial [Methanosphaera sp. WGK6]|uniref:restriction endonuclease subunit S n=1 Tax=Methanosphaera sp. WGK6 TaxID=1561964 RepID=UPI00086875EA